MAIYIGNTHLTGTTEVDIGGTPSTVYIGNFLTYPEGNITYVFSDIKRNSNTDIPAAGTSSNTRWVTADITVKRGSTVIVTYDDVTLDPRIVSGDTTHFHTTIDNKIYADDRANVTGASRSAYFTFSYNGVDVPAAAGTFTQQANSRYTAETTLALTAYTMNNYDYTGGTIYIPCNRRYDTWEYYTSGYNRDGDISSSTNSVVTTAMTYFDTEYYGWLTTGTTQGTGYPRSLIMDENYGAGEGNNRSATIAIGYPVNGSWTDSNYITASTTIEQWGRPKSSYAYRVSNIDVGSGTTWYASNSGTAYTHTITATCEYQTTTWRGIPGSTASTTTTGNWTTYTGRPDMCGNERPYASMGSGYPYFYLRNAESGTTGYSTYLYYVTTASTYGTVGVFPYQANSSTSDRNQDVYIIFGTASTTTRLTQLGNIYYQLSPDSLSFPATGATSALTVSASSSGWGVSASTNWLSLSTVGNNVYVTASNNVGPATQARTGSVSIYYNGTVYDTTTVSQVADNYVFTALTTTEVSLAATATSYSNLAIQSTKAGNALPITTSNISITNNTMNLGISGDLVTGGTGIYMVPLSCSTNTSTSTTKSATLTITQPESGKQLVYHFQQGVADNTNIPGVAKLFDLENGWQVGTVTIAWGGSNSTEPVKMIVVVRKSATTNTSITMLGDYLLFPPPNHERTIVQINGGSAKTFSYTSGSTFQLTDVSDKNNPQTLTLNGVNTTFSGINATMNRSTTTPPVSGTCYITIT